MRHIFLLRKLSFVFPAYLRIAVLGIQALGDTFYFIPDLWGMIQNPVCFMVYTVHCIQVSVERMTGFWHHSYQWCERMIVTCKNLIFLQRHTWRFLKNVWVTCWRSDLTNYPQIYKDCSWWQEFYCNKPVTWWHSPPWTLRDFRSFAISRLGNCFILIVPCTKNWLMSIGFLEQCWGLICKKHTKSKV